MDGAAGEANGATLRVAFDPRLKLEFHGTKITSDAGLLPFRDLDDALGLTDLAGEALTDTRTGQNGRHTLDRKSTRLNSSHANISYAVFCLKKKNNHFHML